MTNRKTFKRDRKTFAEPFRPTDLWTRSGAKIVEIRGCDHSVEFPSRGQSQDVWNYVAVVSYPEDPTKEFITYPHPGLIVHGGPAGNGAGHLEANELSRRMNEYLDLHGTWNWDPENGPHGWSATDRSKK